MKSQIKLKGITKNALNISKKLIFLMKMEVLKLEFKRKNSKMVQFIMGNLMIKEVN